MRYLGLTALLGLVALLIVPTAWAEEGRGRGPRGPRQHPPWVRQLVLEKYDANQDGKLDETEREAAREGIKALMQEHRRKILAEFDTDGDGKLGEEERKAARKAHREKMRQRMLEKFDANGDGEIDEEEKAAAREAFKQRMIERFDKNGDGELDEDERAEARRAMQRRGHRRMRHRRHPRGGDQGPATPSD